ncbi:ATP/GTP-binding protein [Streptomyces chartreusis]
MGEAVEGSGRRAATARLLTPLGLGLSAALLSSAILPSGAQAAPIEGGSCDGNGQWVVCEADDSSSSAGQGAKPSTDGKGSSKPPPCTYEKMDPQPPVGSGFGGDRKPGEVAYIRTCKSGPDGAPIRSVIIADEGADVPVVDPQAVAQLAVARMKLLGPKVASPRAAGKYTVGVPMWLWVDQSPTTFGPNTASATAGGVTVTATASVASIQWDMGDGTEPVTCTGAGTAYKAEYGLKASPDCGHLFRTTSAGKSDGKFQGTATSTWTVTWQVNGGGGNGQFTEIRTTDFAAAVGELKVLD